MENYEHWFGTAPPADVWPSSQMRFGRAPHDQRVNTRDWWMGPRERIARTSALAACSLAAVLFACAACASGSDDGLALLLFFVFAGAVVIGWLVKRSRADPGSRRGDSGGPGDHHGDFGGDGDSGWSGCSGCGGCGG